MKNKIIKVALFIALLLCVNSILKYTLFDDSKGSSRITMHDFYELENNDIKILFLGASHFYSGVDCNLISDEIGVSCFNLSTPSQPIQATYYLLKEAYENHNEIEEVFILLTPKQMADEYNNITYFRVTDYMKPGKNKLGLIIDGIHAQDYDDLLMPVYRETDTINNPNVMELINNTLSAKDEAYQSYVNELYIGRGSWKKNYVFNYTLPGSSDDINRTVDDFDEKKLQYLDKCVKYCKEKNIKLKIMFMPYSNLLNTVNVESFEGLSTYFKEYAENNEIEFEDYNKISYADMGLNKNSFADQDHLTYEGEENFSSFLAKQIKGEAKYSSFNTVAERLSNDSTNGEIYGILYLNEFENGNIKSFWIEPYFTKDKKYTWRATTVEILNISDVEDGADPEYEKREILFEYDGNERYTYDLSNRDYIEGNVLIEAIDEEGNIEFSETIKLY